MSGWQKYLIEDSGNPNFERWKYYIDTAENQRSEKLTEEQLRKWANDPNRMLECIFCQIVEPPSYFHLPLFWKNKHRPSWGEFVCCPRCREYKGIQPHIPGWSDFE